MCKHNNWAPPTNPHFPARARNHETTTSTTQTNLIKSLSSVPHETQRSLFNATKPTWLTLSIYKRSHRDSQVPPPLTPRARSVAAGPWTFRTHTSTILISSSPTPVRSHSHLSLPSFSFSRSHLCCSYFLGLSQFTNPYL